MVIHCDRCKKTANIYTLIGKYQYCDKCVGLVRATVRKLLGYFNDHPNLVLRNLRNLYLEFDEQIEKGFK